MSNMPGASIPPPPPTGGPGGGEIIYPQQPPKDPILILVLNLLLGGCVGYFMIQQKWKAIIALVLWILGIPFTCGTLSGLVGIVAGIDGYLQAQQLQAGHPIGPWTFFQQHL